MLLFRIIYYFFYSRYLIKKYAYPRPKFEDRDVLERIIFPYVLSRLNPRRILDIGREDYQKFYNLFFRGRELWTLDKDPARQEFGADNHIVDDVANLRKHFQANYFDFILLNGVFGWGLNDKKDIEKTFTAIYEVLRPGGLFVFGWNDTEDLTPMPLNKIKALARFKPFYFKPLSGATFKAKTGEHTYGFYTK
jgi:SAM-dependent methyltransferase